MILAIAAIPAVAVAVISSTTGSRMATLLAALIAVAVGLLTGNPAYAALDVGCVAIAIWLSWPQADPKKVQATATKRAAQRAYYESAEYKRKENLWTVVGGVAMVGGYLLYLFWPIVMTNKLSFVPPSNTTVTAPSTYAVTVPAAVAKPLAPKVSKAAAGKEPQISRPQKVIKTTFQQCVQIPDEGKMQNCLEKLK